MLGWLIIYVLIVALVFEWLTHYGPDVDPRTLLITATVWPLLVLAVCLVELSWSARSAARRWLRAATPGA